VIGFVQFSSMRIYVKYMHSIICVVCVLHSYVAVFFFLSEFQGDPITSYVDGSKILHFPSRTRHVYVLQSLVCVCAFAMLVIGMVVSIYAIRFTVEPNVGFYYAQIGASICNSVQINIMNIFYSMISIYLTNRENHRYVVGYF
jgi:hypothetical protein